MHNKSLLSLIFYISPYLWNGGVIEMVYKYKTILFFLLFLLFVLMRNQPCNATSFLPQDRKQEVNQLVKKVGQ